MKTVEDFIRVYDIFDKEYCQELIDYFNNGKPEFKNNDNKPRFHQIEFEEPMMEMMIWRVAPFLDKYVKLVGCEQWLPQKFSWEFARIKKYHKNTEDQFAPHVDVGDHASAKRFLAFLVYLNDVEEGGETEFRFQKRRIKPTAGTVVLFPAAMTHVHKGNMVMGEDNKYIVTGWYIKTPTPIK